MTISNGNSTGIAFDTRPTPTVSSTLQGERRGGGRAGGGGGGGGAGVRVGGEESREQLIKKRNHSHNQGTEHESTSLLDRQRDEKMVASTRRRHSTAAVVVLGSAVATVVVVAAAIAAASAVVRPIGVASNGRPAEKAGEGYIRGGGKVVFVRRGGGERRGMAEVGEVRGETIGEVGGERGRRLQVGEEEAPLAVMAGQERELDETVVPRGRGGGGGGGESGESTGREWGREKEGPGEAPVVHPDINPSDSLSLDDQDAKIQSATAGPSSPDLLTTQIPAENIRGNSDSKPIAVIAAPEEASIPSSSFREEGPTVLHFGKQRLDDDKERLKETTTVEAANNEVQEQEGEEEVEYEKEEEEKEVVDAEGRGGVGGGTMGQEEGGPKGIYELAGEKQDTENEEKEKQEGLTQENGEVVAASAAPESLLGLVESAVEEEGKHNQRDAEEENDEEPQAEKRGEGGGRMVSGTDLGVWSSESGGEVDGKHRAELGFRGLGEFPSLEDSTVMFLHVFKCAGYTLRRMLVDWAGVEGKSGAVVVKCDDIQISGKVCLSRYQLLDEEVQRKHMAGQKVLAGHFLWGFQRHIETPTLLITALRNPLELFVSAQQFIHRKKSKTLDEAQKYMSSVMFRALRRSGAGAAPGEWQVERNTHTGSGFALEEGGPEQITGFIRRFVAMDQPSLHGEGLEKAAAEAAANMESFWVVGVVEQYAGFEEVLRRLLDPEGKYGILWEEYASRHMNSSPIKSTDILAAVDPSLVQQFNVSLSLQWSLYDKAVGLWGMRCTEVLPAEMHKEMCRVPLPSVVYTS